MHGECALNICSTERKWDVHPFYVKCDWNPPVQPSVAFESCLEEVKSQLAGMKITKPKNNLLCKEHEALTELKQNKDINLKKADKGSTTVVMNKTDKIREGQIQIDDKHNYRPLSDPMGKEMHSKVLRLTTDLHCEKLIDDMTRNHLGHPPEFYTLTKFQKPTITGGPIISGCDGPTERISSFVDTLL